jgi:hypothetical protein
MSDQAESVGKTSERKPTPPTIREVFQFTKDNFVLVSAIAVLVGIAFATTVLAAYLSVFDWHLIWFVQYPDILTFGLIAVGIIPGSTLFLLPMAQGMLLEREAEGSFKPNSLIFTSVVVLALIAFTIWGAVRRILSHPLGSECGRKRPPPVGADRIAC